MHGTNPVHPNEQHLDGKAVRLQSMFYTLQGEGPYSGYPCIFIRLAGCNLRCTFCDTDFTSKVDNLVNSEDLACHAWDLWQEHRRQAPHAILNKCTNLPLVVITGGEPLLQNIAGLISHLRIYGFRKVQIETAGTVWDPRLDQAVFDGALDVVCSPKTPRVHGSVELFCRHWKYIIQAGCVSDEDGLPNVSTQPGRGRLGREAIFRPARPGNTIWCSPCDAQDADITKKNTEQAVASCLKFGYRLSLQTHKLVGVE